MTTSAGQYSNLGQLLTDFAANAAGIAHAAVVSSSGNLVARSTGLPADRAAQLTAVATSLMQVSENASNCFAGGVVHQTVVEMEHGYLYLMSIPTGGSLVTLASPRCDIGAVAYEMATFVESVAADLAPELREQLQAERGTLGNE